MRRHPSFDPTAAYVIREPRSHVHVIEPGARDEAPLAEVIDLAARRRRRADRLGA